MKTRLRLPFLISLLFILGIAVYIKYDAFIKFMYDRSAVRKYHSLCNNLHLKKGLEEHIKQEKDKHKRDAKEQVKNDNDIFEVIQYDNLIMTKEPKSEFYRHKFYEEPSEDMNNKFIASIRGEGIYMVFDEDMNTLRISNDLIPDAIIQRRKNLVVKKAEKHDYKDTLYIDQNKPVKSRGEIRKQAEEYLNELTGVTIRKYQWAEPSIRFCEDSHYLKTEKGYAELMSGMWEIKWLRKIGVYETEYDCLTMKIDEEYGLYDFWAGIGSEYKPMDIPPTQPPKQVNSTQLKQTIISSHMEENITTGNNLIYCSTFQMAWNEYKDNITKEDIRIAGDPTMVRFLNKSLSTKNEISEKDYVAMVGYGGDNIVDKINKALMDKFGNKAPVVKESLGPGDILAYAFLLKDLPFKYGFDRFDEPLDFGPKGQKVPVKVFGLERKPVNQNYDEVLKQIIVYYNEWDKNEDDFNFIIGLIATSDNDDIILAKVKPESTLLKTLEAIDNIIKTSKPEILTRRADLTVQIPILDFNIKHSYSELIGKIVLNNGHSVAKAEQNIKFTLNDKGATLISDASFKTLIGGTPRFIFDKPFLVCLKQKGAKYPYFAMWVDNTELMLKDEIAIKHRTNQEKKGK